MVGVDVSVWGEVGCGGGVFVFVLRGGLGLLVDGWFWRVFLVGIEGVRWDGNIFVVVVVW